MSNRTTTHPQNVADAVVIKSEDLFLLSEHDGSVPAGSHDGFGLYYHDCRFLNRYDLRIDGTTPNSLVATADRGSVSEFELTNATLQPSGASSIQQQTFGVRLERSIDPASCAVHDIWTVRNYDVEKHTVTLSFGFDSKFESIFEIRGLHPAKIGRNRKTRWKSGALVFSYDGADGIERRLEVHADPKPGKCAKSGMEYKLTLKPGQQQEIRITLCVVESRNRKQAAEHRPQPHPGSAADHHAQEWLEKNAQVRSGHPLLDHVLRRGLLDLLMLRGSLDGYEYFSAGLPWYGTLFGRDSIIASLQTLAFQSGIAEQTIRLLAKYQGAKTDDWRDEEPGKILHELRRGELAHLNEIPQTPYYGAVDSTPLFLILVGEHAKWTGDLQLFRDVRSNIDRALQWIDSNMEQTGYLTYASKSKHGLGNQGWKDSGDSIMNADGSLATPPIALVEVQGYVYLAKLLIADLYERSGEQAAAARLRSQARDLRTRFNRDFWVKRDSFYAIALQKGNRPAAVISSNPGQALWTGIVDESRSQAVVRHLMARDMFSGWGVRTLSLEQTRANPIGYHLGTVWPHDNSIIVAGMKRYGFNEEAARVLNGIIAAGRHFSHYRLPEVFAGFSRQEFPLPVRYPVACHPQAWAAGSVPSMLTSLLGIVPDAESNQLKLVDPVLPQGVTQVEVQKIRVGKATADLRFRKVKAEVEVEVVDSTGGLNVVVESERQSKAA